MNRLLTSLSSVALVAGLAQAQCFQSSGTSTLMTPDGSGFPAFDEGYSAELPIGFTFPMAGVGYAITHCVIDSNGEIYLTDGTGVVNPSSFGTETLTALRGGVGGSARVMAMGGDNEGAQITSDVLVDTSVAGEFKVTWLDWSRFGAGQSWDMSVTLFSDGDIQCDYSAGFTGFDGGDIAGVSIGNNVGTGTEASSDLSAGGNSGALGLIYQNVWPFDMENSSLTYEANGSGGYSYSITCVTLPAANLNYGAGCYQTFNSFYQTIATPALAATALTGNALRLTPTVSGYTATWLAGAAAGLFIAPGGGTILATTDDGQATYTPGAGFPSPFGAVTDLRVHGNGIVAFGSAAIDTPGTSSWIPTAPAFLNGARGGVYSWHDFNEGEGGDIIGESNLGVVRVTYNNVESYPFGPVNPSTLQFQFDQTTGVITVVWIGIEGVGTDSHLIGWTPAGPSLDPGSITLATQLPVTTGPDSPAMSMSASPAPISTPIAGTNVVYTINDIPLACPLPAPVFHFGIVMLSIGQDLAGTDLLTGYAVDAPGCNFHITSVVVTLSYVGAVPTNTVSFFVPPGVGAGFEFYAQAAALVCPGTLPNGLNNAGVTVSNGVRSIVNSF